MIMWLELKPIKVSHHPAKSSGHKQYNGLEKFSVNHGIFHEQVIKGSNNFMGGRKLLMVGHTPLASLVAKGITVVAT